MMHFHLLTENTFHTSRRVLGFRPILILILACSSPLARFRLIDKRKFVAPQPKNQPLARSSSRGGSAYGTIYQQALRGPNLVESTRAEILPRHEMQSLPREL